MIGRILGNRYKLLQVVGEGGMSVVYKATDMKLNRPVAVKILKKEFADNVEISDKFKKEATAIANLSHTNIVNVLDVGHGEEENLDYFVMEYVDGKTLKDIIIYNGRLSYTTAIDIATQIAKALDCAHKNNIIHRDIKPQNILVTAGGDVKVTDFGIAKSSTSATITNTTTIMGSAHYLSPEQAKGSFIDIRTDLYSLGIVIYEMVTGKLPFQGESPVTVALKHIQEQPPTPKVINPSIPESINNLILKSIEKQPVKRYQTANELILDLQKIKDNPDVIIGVIAPEDDSKTILMEPIKANEILKKNNIQTYVDEDEDYEDEDEEEEYRKKIKARRRKSNLGVFVIVVVALMMVSGGVFFGLKYFKPKSVDVTVPNFIDKTQDEAKQLAEGLGLKVDVIGTKHSDKPNGTVLESNPVADTVVKKGSTIKVVVSGGEEKITVPDLKNRDLDYIKKVLEQKGLVLDVQEEYNEDFSKGEVVSQEPAKDTEVVKGSTVRVIVSKGRLVQIDNYNGKDAATIKKELEALKINVVLEDKETDRESENGKVVGQSVSETKVVEGTTITLSVGKYVVPTINIATIVHEGMILRDAIHSLTQAGISYEISGGHPQESDYDKYTVKSFTQSIKKGETVKLEIVKIPTNTENNNSGTNSGTSTGTNGGATNPQINKPAH